MGVLHVGIRTLLQTRIGICCQQTRAVLIMFYVHFWIEEHGMRWYACTGVHVAGSQPLTACHGLQPSSTMQNLTTCFVDMKESMQPYKRSAARLHVSQHIHSSADGLSVPRAVVHVSAPCRM